MTRLNRSAALQYVALVILFSISTCVSAQGMTKLFHLEPAQTQQDVLQHVSPAVQARLHDPAVSGLSLAKVNASAVAQDVNELELDLAPGIVVQARKLRFESLQDGMSLWEGESTDLRALRKPSPAEVPMDSLNAVMLVRHGENVTGSVRVNGEVFQIIPLGGGVHAILHIDTTKLPTDLVLGADNTHATPVQDSHKKEAARLPTRHSDYSTIRVMVAISKQVKEQAVDVEGQVALDFAEANQGNENSRVAIDFQNAGILYTDFDEANVSYAQILSNAINLSHPTLGLPIYLSRKERRADLVVIMVTNRQYCGLATLDADMGTAFAVVTYMCAPGYYTFAHEMGHNIGTQHDRASLGYTTTPSYRHGYIHTTGEPGWRTLMAYECSYSRPCPALNNWSNPDVTYNGNPTGTVQYENNTRRLNERREYVADFYPPPDGAAPPEVVATVSPSSATGEARVTLDGSGSSNPGGGALRYEWSQVSGAPAASIDNGTLATTIATIPVVTQPTTYTFRLVVTNADDLSASKEVSVSAQPAGEGELTATLVAPDTVQSGAPVPLRLEVVNPGGRPLTYQWFRTTELFLGTIGNNPSGTYTAAQVDKDTPGLISAEVSDGTDTFSTPIKTVVIKAQPAGPPMAVAVANPTTATSGTRVRLDGSGSSNPGGGALSYAWQLVGGSPSMVIENSSLANASVTIPALTTTTSYTFELTVRNSAGLSNSARVSITAQTSAVTATLTVPDTAPSGGPVPVRVDAHSEAGLPLHYTWFRAPELSGSIGDAPSGTFTAPHVDQNKQLWIGVSVSDGTNTLVVPNEFVTIKPGSAAESTGGGH